jgi:hypothetical protein
MGWCTERRARQGVTAGHQEHSQAGVVTQQMPLSTDSLGDNKKDHPYISIPPSFATSTLHDAICQD